MTENIKLFGTCKGCDAENLIESFSVEQVCDQGFNEKMLQNYENHECPQCKAHGLKAWRFDPDILKPISPRVRAFFGGK